MNEVHHTQAPSTITLTAESLKDIVATAVREATRPNPLEERKLQQEIEADARRNQMAVELGKIEAESMRRKRDGCSHTRDNVSGAAVARGSYGAVWTTQGQSHGDGTITLLCMRCANTWRFRATPQEIDYSINAEHGLLGFAPPPPERCIEAA